MSTANKDGWIEWSGGGCPVKDDCVVSVRFRDGTVFEGSTSVQGRYLHWGHDAGDSNIMAYRLHKPAAQNPLEWRDRIREIDAQIEALEEERVSLVQRLEDEGFQLIGRVDEKSECKAADLADMSDWRNWKAGDVIECVNDDGWESFKLGRKYYVKHVDADRGVMFAGLKGYIFISFIDDFKFHSRPSSTN